MTTTGPVLPDAGRALLHVGESAGGAASFTRHRYELPLLGVFLGLAAVELVAVHLLVSLWKPAVAWVLTALSAAAILQIAFLIRGLKRHPTTVDAQHIHVRHGWAGDLPVPLASIASVENVAFAPEEHGRGVFRASLIASPNVALRLREAVAVRRRSVSLVTLRIDDPEAFIGEVRARAAAASAPVNSSCEASG